jgi:hypothetical protein
LRLREAPWSAAAKLPPWNAVARATEALYGTTHHNTPL